MSRPAQRSSMPASASNTNGAAVVAAAADDICPVCKSSRYLNPNMKFLVNPECYHKMCSSCVDRIFSAGPAQCPVAGCRRTLRKARFRAQTFEDLGVEREVDVRRRVAAVFNRREEEFDTLLDYNNYLEMVENLTFELVSGIEVEKNEAILRKYKEENERSIKENAILEGEEASSVQAREKARREQARLAREAQRLEEEQERKEREKNQKQIIDRLASGEGDAEKIAREGERVMLKRTTARRAVAERRDASDGLANGNALAAGEEFVIRGLKKVQPKEPEKPYDPFGGITITPEYYVLQDHYEWSWLDEARNNPTYTAGGYNVNEYCQRALCDAFSGLGVIIGSDAPASEIDTMS